MFDHRSSSFCRSTTGTAAMMLKSCVPLIQRQRLYKHPVSLSARCIAGWSPHSVSSSTTTFHQCWMKSSQCLEFGYHLSSSFNCRLYNFRPKNYDVTVDCQHYTVRITTYSRRRLHNRSCPSVFPFVFTLLCEPTDWPLVWVSCTCIDCDHSRPGVASHDRMWRGRSDVDPWSTAVRLVRHEVELHKVEINCQIYLVSLV